MYIHVQIYTPLEHYFLLPVHIVTQNALFPADIMYI